MGELHSLVGDGLGMLLERLDEGVMVLDRNRNLCFVNARARSLLGFAAGEMVGGRCRHSTHGVDCEDACPLSFALATGSTSVDRFSTVYRGRGERPVSLDVTVIPLRDGNGELRGAVEILRPTAADPGYISCGHSDGAQWLRREIERLGRAMSALLIVGEERACYDVARAVHRVSRLDDGLFLSWHGSWDGVPLWPSGTMYASGEPALALLADESTPAGWRVVGAVTPGACPTRDELPAAELLRLPALEERADDLPLVVAALVKCLKPSLTVEAQALERLCRLCLAEGLDRLHEVLAVAVAAADGVLGNEQLLLVGCRSVLMDELLADPAPLAAMENRILEEVLMRTGWRMQDAADRLGISRVTLWRKLKEHGIERPASEG